MFRCGRSGLLPVQPFMNSHFHFLLFVEMMTSKVILWQPTVHFTLFWCRTEMVHPCKEPCFCHVVMFKLVEMWQWHGWGWEQSNMTEIQGCWQKGEGTGTLKFLSPTNAPLYYTYKMLKYTARLSHDCSYMFRSTWTIIRLRRYRFCNHKIVTLCKISQ
jgi:hypothetical protein